MYYWLLWLILQWTWRCRYLFKIDSISFWQTLRIWVTGSHGSSIFNFSGNSILLFIVTAPFYIPTNMYKGSFFPTSTHFLHLGFGLPLYSLYYSSLSSYENTYTVFDSIVVISEFSIKCTNSDFFKKFYFILLYNTVLVLPYIDMNPNWKRHVYPNVHCSNVYNSQDMETT